MRMTRSRSALAAIALTVVAASAPGAAVASAAPLDDITLFGGDQVDNNEGRTALAVAEDGSIAVAREYPNIGGAVDVVVRRPGATFLRTNLVPTGTKRDRVLLAGGAGGALAVVYTGSATTDLQVRIMPSGSSQWSDPMTLPPYLVNPGSIAFGPDGRLWVGTQGGSPNQIRLYIVPATGTGPVSTIPVEYSATPYSNLVLDVGPDGVGRVAFRSEVSTYPPSGQPCTLTTGVWTADVLPTALTVAPALRDTYTVMSTSIGYACPTGNGATGLLIDQQAGPHVVATPDGATTITYETSVASGPSSTTIRAVRRAPGGEWPTTSEVALPASATIGTILHDTIAVGNRVGQVYTPSQTLSVALRDGAGTWTPLPLGLPGLGPKASGSASGAALFAALNGGSASAYPLSARYLNADGTLDPVVNLPNGTFGFPIGAGTDAAGNAALGFSSIAGSGQPAIPKLRPFDATGPSLSEVRPASALVNVPTSLTSSALDVWSGASTPAWTFDDGTTASGATVSHTFTSVGPHQVTVSSVDTLGKSGKRTATISVASVVPPMPTRDTVAPVVTAGRVTPTKPTAKKPGALAFTSSEPGSATVSLTGTTKGVKKGRRCVAPGRVTGKKCTRALASRTVTLTASGAAQGVVLPKLPAGSWTATVVVADAAGNQGRTTTTFTVKAARKAKRVAKKAA